MSKPLLGTPEHIKAKSVEVLRPLAGMSYADALYVLEIAQRTMADAVDRLHAEQVFNPLVFQCSPPKDSGDRL